MKNRHTASLIVTVALLALAALACAPAEEAPEPVDLEAPLAGLAEG